MRRTPFKKDKLQNISVMYDFQLILYTSQKLKQLHAMLQQKVVFQKLNYVLEIFKFPS